MEKPHDPAGLNRLLLRIIKDHGEYALQVLDFSNSRYTHRNDPIDYRCRNCNKNIHQALACNSVRKNYNLCPHCGINKNGSTDLQRRMLAFVVSGAAKHPNMFDYSLIGNYFVGDMTPVPIRCVKHDHIFLETPHSHLISTHCCPICTHEAQSKCKMITQEVFEERSKIKHGNNYGYDKAKYTGYDNPIIIYCNYHQCYFECRSAGKHMTDNGVVYGCPRCGYLRSSQKQMYTRKEILERAIITHGYRYGYDKVKYTGINNKVDIYCYMHDYFPQDMDCHVNRGQGCPKCGNISKGLSKRKTTEQFKEEADEIFGYIYGYDLVEYITNKDKISVYCYTHEKYFYITPSSHLAGHGCIDCGYIRSSEIQRLTKEEFKTKAIIKHGFKYGYDKVVYINNKTNVTIYCNKHEEYFEQTPSSHLHGIGCPRCARDSAADMRRLTNEEFKERGIAVHGERYGYDKVKYVRTDKDVIITCKKHGDFEQRPDNHLQGKGCKSCKSSLGEKIILNLLLTSGLFFKPQFAADFLPNRRVDFLVIFNGIYIVIEYDGIQHFEFVKHFRNTLEQNHDIDIEKTKAYLQNGYRVIRIDYTVNDISQYLEQAIDEILQGCLLCLSTPSMYDWLTDPLNCDMHITTITGPPGVNQDTTDPTVENDQPDNTLLDTSNQEVAAPLNFSANFIATITP